MQIPKQKSLKLNFAMNLLLTASSFVFPLITFAYSSRILGPNGTGTVAFCLSIVSYFSMFAQLGIQVYGVRICAGVRDDKEKLSETVQELLIITLSTSALSYIILGFLLLFCPELSEDTNIILMLCPLILLNTLGAEWLYKALEEYTYITIRSIAVKILGAVLLFFVVVNDQDYVQYAFIVLFINGASSILNLCNMHKHITFSKKGKYCFKRHIKPLILLFLSSFAVSVYTNLDLIMLGFMSSKVEAGYYDAAMNVRRVLTSLVTSLGVVLLPRASYYIENNLYDDFVSISKKAIGFVFYSSIPMAAFVALYSLDVLVIVVGDAYHAAAIPTSILSIVIVLVGLSNITGTQMLIPLKQDSAMFWSALAAAILDFVLNLFLIPMLGATGTAISTVFAETTILILQIMWLRKFVKLRELFIFPIKPVISTIVSLLIAFSLTSILDGGLIGFISGFLSFALAYIIISRAIKDPFTIEIFDLARKGINKVTHPS